MLNIMFELGQMLFLGALVYGAFLCFRESESFRALAGHMQFAEDREPHEPVNRKLAKAMLPRISGV